MSLDRVRELLKAAERVADPSDVLGKQARDQLYRNSGLSREGVDFALSECLETSATDEQLARLVDAVPTCGTAHVVLSANVFVGALRAIAIGLVAAPRVFVKPSRRAPDLTLLLHSACPELFQVCTELSAVPGDHVWAYGSDATLDTIAQSLSDGVVFHRHGFGLGIAIVQLSSQTESELAVLANQLCRDIVPFDQRGCLSPRLVFVCGGEGITERWTRELERALAEWRARIPLGSIDPGDHSNLAWYEHTLAYTGQVRGSIGALVGIDRGSRALLLPPPLRCLHQICLLEMSEADAVRQAISANPALANWITCVGCSNSALLEAATRSLPAARVTHLGQMQRPPLDGPVDRRVAVEGQILGPRAQD